MVQWLRLRTPKAEGPGLIPGQGSRSHVLQLRVHTPQLKIPSLQLRPGVAKSVSKQILKKNKTLEEEMATHSSTLAWEVSWTEQSMALQRVAHNLATKQQQHTTRQTVNWGNTS